MKQNTILIAIIALLVGGIGVYLVIGNDAEDYAMGDMMSDRTGEQRGQADAGVHTMPDGTMMGNDMPMGNMGNTDGMDHSMMMVSSEREFVTGMIPHHQEAANTAKEVLARGGSTTEIRTLAEEIIEAQEIEIAMLKEWHLAWYGEVYEENDSYQPMMRDLSLLSGATLDQRFLEDMIPHHMGAIMMAQSVRPYITHQEVTDMADAIMQTQSAEIQLMQELLKTL
jgi:uncharacterized protein (DUF305 family)